VAPIYSGGVATGYSIRPLRGRLRSGRPEAITYF